MGLLLLYRSRWLLKGKVVKDIGPYQSKTIAEQVAREKYIPYCKSEVYGVAPSTGEIF